MSFFRRLRSLFHKETLETEMADEMRHHVELQTDLNLKAGMNAVDARYAALRQFGNVAIIQEQARAVRGWLWLEQFGQDLRYAVRSLRKTPGFTAITVLSLALGIGANTALFSLVDEVLLRSLPVKAPGELVVFRWLSNALPAEGMVGGNVINQASGLPSGTQFPLPIFERLRGAASSMSEVFAFAPLFGLTVATDVQASRATGQLVTGNYYSSLGVSAWRGRTLNPEDDRTGATPVAVIGHRFWRQNFEGDENAVGKVLKVNQLSFTIVGIMPEGFLGTLEAGQAPDVTIALSQEPQLNVNWSWTVRPHIWWLHIMGRLKPSVTVDQARAQLEPVFLQAVREARQMVPSRRKEGSVEPRDMFGLQAGRQGLADTRETYRQPLSILLGIVGLVLLLACLNVANLLLARSLARRREFALRLSLGATGGRVIRQLLTESGLLALAGGLAGLAIAGLGRKGLLQLWPVGDSGSLVIDGRVLGFTVLTSFLTGLSFGLASAWQVARVDLNSVLKGGNATGRGGLRASLTVAQVALSSILLICAGLFIGTLRNLRGIETGFDRTHLLRFQLNAGGAGYSTSQASALFERIRAQLAELPGVQSAAFAGRQGRSPDFRKTMGITLRSGRDFTEQDGTGSPLVALVNEAFVKARFPGESPIGRRYTIRGSSALKTPDRVVEIVGVVGDIREGDARRKIDPSIYVPYSQDPLTFANASFVIRTRGDAGALASDIRRTVRAIEPAISVDELLTEEEQTNRLFSRERLFALLSSWFGGLALLLTCIGLYGLLDHEVTARTREIGIRMAVGAQKHEAVGLVMRSGLGLALLGCLLGIAGALGATRLLGKFLYGIDPADPTTFLAMPTILLIVAGLACWLPARRAAKVDPMVALRAE